MYIFLHEILCSTVCRTLWRPEALPGPLELKLHMETNPGFLQKLSTVPSPWILNLRERSSKIVPTDLFASHSF